jgi:hypothetical protein
MNGLPPVTETVVPDSLGRGGSIHLILHGHTPRLGYGGESMSHPIEHWNQVGFRAKADSGAGPAANAL